MSLDSFVVVYPGKVLLRRVAGIGVGPLQVRSNAVAKLRAEDALKQPPGIVDVVVVPVHELGYPRRQPRACSKVQSVGPGFEACPDRRLQHGQCILGTQRATYFLVNSAEHVTTQCPSNWQRVLTL